MPDLKPLVTLLAIVNPLACVPFFIHYTQNFSPAQKRKTIWLASFTVFCVIAMSALVGLRVLGFFGISLAGFQVGGSLLLLMASLAMLNAQPAEAKTNASELESAQERAAVAVVPLGIPLLTGPATISTVMLMSKTYDASWQVLWLIAFGIVVALTVALCFRFSDAIERLLGKTGINVMTRLMGLMLASLAVEVMAKGLVQLFPVLGSSL